MVALPGGVLVLFAVSWLVAFLLPFLKTGELKQLSVGRIAGGLPVLAILFAPFAVLFAIGYQLKIETASAFPWFAGTLVLSYLLHAVGMSARLRGLLLLGAAVLLTINLPAADTFLPVSAAILALLVWKLVENLLVAERSTLDDALAPFIWLAGIAWIRTGPSSAAFPMQEGALLGIISVALLLRLVQAPLLHEDRAFVKRVVLAITGGLAVLIVITKLLLAMDITPIALLVGAGFFATYMFELSAKPAGAPAGAARPEPGTGASAQKTPGSTGQAQEPQEPGTGASAQKTPGSTGQAQEPQEPDYYVSPTSAVKLLILIGILTLVATRFFGNFGLVALAPTALIATRAGVGQYGGIFWVTRCFLQSYIVQYNLNITGINITHAYAGAALYGGFVALVVLALFMREVRDRRWLASAFVGASALVPILANYFLHAEPTSSLLVAATVAGVVLAATLPPLQGTAISGQENLLLVPAAMISGAILTSNLIELGNETTIEVKTHVMAYSIAFLVAALVAMWAVTRFTGRKQRPAPAADGN